MTLILYWYYSTMNYFSILQQAVIVLFLQLNPYSSVERHLICNQLKWCFAQCTWSKCWHFADLWRLSRKYHLVINLGHIFCVLNWLIVYITNKSSVIVDIQCFKVYAHCLRPTRYSNALLIRSLRFKHAAYSLSTHYDFHNPESFFFMRGLCAVYMWLGQTSVNENTTNLERVLYVCLTLDWWWSDVLLTSLFSPGKTLTVLNVQKMCAEVDAHNKWVTFS